MLPFVCTYTVVQPFSSSRPLSCALYTTSSLIVNCVSAHVSHVPVAAACEDAMSLSGNALLSRLILITESFLPAYLAVIPSRFDNFTALYSIHVSPALPTLKPPLLPFCESVRLAPLPLSAYSASICVFT